jgi:hypothetical protein
MRTLLTALFFCLGLLSAGCDDKPKPGGPMPKAAAVSLAAPSLA